MIDRNEAIAYIVTLFIMFVSFYVMLHGIAAQQELTEQRNQRLWEERR